jgi:pilus assembly protein Flp/PilA
MDIIGYWTKTCAPFIRARFGRNERGAALVEYALLLALIAVVCIVALTTLGGKASSKFVTIGNSL